MLTLEQQVWGAMMIDFARELSAKIATEVIKRYTRLNPQGLGPRKLPPIPDKWTWRSGRLGRSVLGARFRSGESENIFEIKEIGKDSLTFTIGSKVIYSGVHEYGAVITQGLASGRVRTIRIPARPYYRPALKDMEKENWAREVFQKVFEKYKNVILKIT